MALASVGGDESPFDQLSPRELEVAMLLVQGMRQDAIARRLSLSPKTSEVCVRAVEDVASSEHRSVCGGCSDAGGEREGRGPVLVAETWGEMVTATVSSPLQKPAGHAACRCWSGSRRWGR